MWENVQGFVRYPEKVMAISGEGVISPLSLESYKESILSQWKTELHNRIIPNYMDEVRECVRLHGEDATDYDIDNWLEIHRLKVYIAKNSLEKKSLLSRAAEALDDNDFAAGIGAAGGTFTEDGALARAVSELQAEFVLSA